MKSTFLTKIFFLFLTFYFQLFTLLAQTPHSFKYQAVVRNNQGQIVQNQLVSLKVSILSGSATGPSVYTETHQKATSEFGIVNLNIGNGTIVSGSFNNIQWGNNIYFVKVELDLTGGGNYTFISTSQLLSVPYALYAEKTAGSESDNDTSSTNELQAISLTNDTLYLSNGGKVFMGGYLDNTDNQTLSLPNPTTLTISNGNSVTLSAGMADLDADPVNELQYLSYSNDTIYLTQGNYVVLPHDADLDSLNEIQVLTKTGNLIELSKNGGSVTDSDNQNLSSSITGTQRTINISGGTGTTIDVADNDNSITNELQNLSYSNDTLSISNGNSVSLNDYSFKSLTFPQGINGHVDTLQCVQQIISYTVPNGKTFYLINGTSDFKYNNNQLNGVGKIILASGTTITSNCVGSTQTFYYLLKPNNNNITPIIFNIKSGGITLNYTVPSGKKLVIKSSGTPVVNLMINNESVLGNYGFYIDKSFLLFAPANSTIKCVASGDGNTWVTGYLMNE